MVDFSWRLISVFGSALVLLFFSEFFFVNEGPVLSLLQSDGAKIPLLLAEMVAFYSIFTYILLIAIDRFSVRTMAGLVLVGALFGWATEALIVPVVHEAPPVTWIFPSIGWHALIDVVVGWYVLRVAMRRLSWPLLSAVFIGTGLIWAFWATWYWTEAETGALPPMSHPEFTKLAIFAGAGWIVGNIIADFGAARRFQASTWESGVVLVITIVLFGSMALPYLPFSLALIAPIALTIWALRRGCVPGQSQVDILAPLAERPPNSAYFASALMPVTAIIGYWGVLKTGNPFPIDVIPLLLMLGGLLVFLWAIWRTAFPKSAR